MPFDHLTEDDIIHLIDAIKQKKDSEDGSSYSRISDTDLPPLKELELTLQSYKHTQNNHHYHYFRTLNFAGWQLERVIFIDKRQADSLSNDSVEVNLSSAHIDFALRAIHATRSAILYLNNTYSRDISKAERQKYKIDLSHDLLKHIQLFFASDEAHLALTYDSFYNDLCASIATILNESFHTVFNKIKGKAEIYLKCLSHNRSTITLFEEDGVERATIVLPMLDLTQKQREETEDIDQAQPEWYTKKEEWEKDIIRAASVTLYKTLNGIENKLEGRLNERKLYNLDMDLAAMIRMGSLDQKWDYANYNTGPHSIRAVCSYAVATKKSLNSSQQCERLQDSLSEISSTYFSEYWGFDTLSCEAEFKAIMERSIVMSKLLLPPIANEELCDTCLQNIINDYLNLISLQLNTKGNQMFKTDSFLKDLKSLSLISKKAKLDSKIAELNSFFQHDDCIWEKLFPHNYQDKKNRLKKALKLNLEYFLSYNTSTRNTAAYRQKKASEIIQTLKLPLIITHEKTQISASTKTSKATRNFYTNYKFKISTAIFFAAAGTAIPWSIGLTIASLPAYGVALIIAAVSFGAGYLLAKGVNHLYQNHKLKKYRRTKVGLATNTEEDTAPERNNTAIPDIIKEALDKTKKDLSEIAMNNTEQTDETFIQDSYFNSQTLSTTQTSTLLSSHPRSDSLLPPCTRDGQSSTTEEAQGAPHSYH